MLFSQGSNGRKEDMRPPSQDSPAKMEEVDMVEIDHVAEKKLVRKLDLYIIPLAMLLYLLSFLDRYGDVRACSI